MKCSVFCTSVVQALSLLFLFAGGVLFPPACFSRPSLRGSGGLIMTPTAYLSTGGSVSPRTQDDGRTETVTNLTYAVMDSSEVGIQRPSQGNTTLSFKYQFTEDIASHSEDTPATAFGLINNPDPGTAKAFYGVMSKRMDETSLVLHVGLISPGSMFGNLRPMGGFEIPLSPRILTMTEYDGLTRNINSGIEYHVSEGVASFVYLLDVASRGLQAEAVSGFSFRMAF